MREQISLLSGGATEEAGPARLSEGRRRGMMALQADLADPQIISAVHMAIGVAPPAPRSAALDGEAGAIWMAPDEALLLAPLGEVGAKIKLIRETCPPGSCAVTDMSDARTILQLAGGGAREVIAKIAPLDMHPSAFRFGAAHRVQLGEIGAIVAQVSQMPEIFEIYAPRSLSDHVWDMLTVANETAARLGLFGGAVLPRDFAS